MGDIMYDMKKVKLLRKEKGITIYDMAKALAITPSFYSQIENCKRRLFYDMAVKIGMILKEKPDVLLYAKES